MYEKSKLHSSDNTWHGSQTIFSLAAVHRVTFKILTSCKAGFNEQCGQVCLEMVQSHVSYDHTSLTFVVALP